MQPARHRSPSRFKAFPPRPAAHAGFPGSTERGTGLSCPVFWTALKGTSFYSRQMETRKALRERVGREQQLIDRLRTATVHFADAQIERAWAISSAHQSGLSIRRIATATDLSPSRVHRVLNSAEATDMPAWLSRLRETDRCLGGKNEDRIAGSNGEMCSRLASEVKVLRRCIDWLERIERGESVVVNLRLDTEENTEYVAFDHARVMRILRRIASDLEGLATGGPIVASEHGQIRLLDIAASWPNHKSNRKNYRRARSGMLCGQS